MTLETLRSRLFMLFERLIAGSLSNLYVWMKTEELVHQYYQANPLASIPETAEMICDVHRQANLSVNGFFVRG